MTHELPTQLKIQSPGSPPANGSDDVGRGHTFPICSSLRPFKAPRVSRPVSRLGIAGNFQGGEDSDMDSKNSSSTYPTCPPAGPHFPGATSATNQSNAFPPPILTTSAAHSQEPSGQNHSQHGTPCSASMILHSLGIGAGHLTPLQSPRQGPFPNGTSLTSAKSPSDTRLGGLSPTLGDSRLYFPSLPSPGSTNSNSFGKETHIREEEESIDGVNSTSDDDENVPTDLGREELARRLASLALRLQSKTGARFLALDQDSLGALATKLDEIEQVLSSGAIAASQQLGADGKTIDCSTAVKDLTMQDIPSSVEHLKSAKVMPPSQPNSKLNVRTGVRMCASRPRRNSSSTYNALAPVTSVPLTPEPPNPLKETSLAKTCPEDADILVAEAEKLCNELATVVTSLRARQEESDARTCPHASISSFFFFLCSLFSYHV